MWEMGLVITGLVVCVSWKDRQGLPQFINLECCNQTYILYEVCTWQSAP
jgi:hypothetical protein